ncbi:MAG: RcpC/CpaB family pilus assembly protein [Actinomycetia bacterium]|nr:RcpC/CpaB family pilus assembly protein [Actinomycetes bacterium]
MALLSRTRPLAMPHLDRRTILGVFLAAVAAGLVLILTQPAVTTPILVAGSDLPAGTPLGQLDLEVRRVASPEGLVVGDSVGDLTDWILRVPVSAGEPLVPSLLLPPQVLDAPEAFALTLDRSHAVQGKIMVGDYVDVLVTTPGNLDTAPITATVASTVYVLDVELGDEGFDADRVAVLLAVDTDLAASLANAREAGTIDLVRVTP